MRTGPTPGELLAGLAGRLGLPVDGDRLRLDPDWLDVIAIGWATVELDRAVIEFSPRVFEPAPDDDILGARTRRAVGGAPDEPALVLLEPNTEGRLAGSLARWGEGAAVAYVSRRTVAESASPEASSVSPAAARPGGGLGGSEGGLRRLRTGQTPFGPARLLLAGSPYGPYLVMVGPSAAAAGDPGRRLAAPGTIER